MKHIKILIIASLLLHGCNRSKYRQPHLLEELERVDTVAIYLPPMNFDTLIASIKDIHSFSGDDTLKYIPSDREITLKFEFSGKMKEYMQHGKMIVRPYEGSISVQRINNSSFKYRVKKPIDDWYISMYYEFTLAKPYFFTYSIDSANFQVIPDDTVSLFLRSEMVKPGNPGNYLKN